jgi:hypothetical protein
MASTTKLAALREPERLRLADGAPASEEPAAASAAAAAASSARAARGWANPAAPSSAGSAVGDSSSTLRLAARLTAGVPSVGVAATLGSLAAAIAAFVRTWPSSTPCVAHGKARDVTSGSQVVPPPSTPSKVGAAR